MATVHNNALVQRVSQESLLVRNVERTQQYPFGVFHVRFSNHITLTRPVSTAHVAPTTGTHLLLHTLEEAQPQGFQRDVTTCTFVCGHLPVT